MSAGRSVLVVDDDRDIRELVSFKLRQAGFEVTVAEDGVTALARLRAAPPDLVLLDVMMPGMSGLEVCRALRADPATEGVLVILLTAMAQHGDVNRGFATGADDYVVKPFSPRDLLARVNAVFARVGV